MSEFDFIIDGLRFSHSSMACYNTCPYSFKLTYIDYLSKEDNFFSDYGLFVHKCMEKYFSGELDSFELSEYYRENFDGYVKTPPPPSYYGNMREKYKLQGQSFFDSFNFPLEQYDIITVEDTIFFNLDGIEITARPDLVLKNKQTGKNILYDYKTSYPFKELKNGDLVADEKKISSYSNQMFIYAYALRTERKLPISEIVLWFPRAFQEYRIKWEKKKEKGAIEWIKNTVNAIKTTPDFPPDNSNPYFCNNLCSVRNHCEYRQ